jgi:hypothetical protein
MKKVLTNTFPIKKMIHGFLTIVFLLPTGTVQSGTRSDTNNVAIDKTKPLENIEKTAKQDSCAAENDTPLVMREKNPGGKNGNWIMPPVVILVYFGKKKQLKGMFGGIGKLMKGIGKQVKKWFKGTR